MKKRRKRSKQVKEFKTRCPYCGGQNSKKLKHPKKPAQVEFKCKFCKLFYHTDYEPPNYREDWEWKKFLED